MAIPEMAGQGTLSGGGSWRDREAGPWVWLLLCVLILAAPGWLYARELRYYTLLGDDFIYISNSLDFTTCVEHLPKPHNTHVVPLWRLWVLALVELGGSLERMPYVLAAGAYLGLVLAMVSTGVLAAKESGRTAVGLAAMAMVGLTTVTRSTLTWFSAGQALWAGTGVILTLLAARRWSIRGGIGSLALMLASAAGAAAFWSGGLLAGPAAAAYLIAKRPKGRTTLPVVLLGAVTLACAGLIVAMSLKAMLENKVVTEVHAGLWPRPIQAVFHCAQGFVEMILVGGLGLDARTTPWQAMGLTLGLLALWLTARGGPGRINALEASGLVVLFGSYYLAYVFRGNLPFDNLREVTWYNATPYLGAILLVSGVWSGSAGPAPVGGRLTLGQAGLVVAISGLLLAIHAPREQRLLIAGAPKLRPSELPLFPIPVLQENRAVYLLEQYTRRQWRSLARLDRAGKVVATLGADREAVRGVFGRIPFPGIPELQTHTDPFSMIPFPRTPTAAPPSPERIRQALDLYVRPEPEARPAWLAPADEWSSSGR